MKIKLDENIPLSVVGLLVALGHDVDTVQQEGLTGRDDGQIWAAAQSEQRFFITQDLDFSDMRKHMPGSHHGLLLVRLSHPGALALSSRLQEAFGFPEVNSWWGCLVVVTDHKLRVVRP